MTDDERDFREEFELDDDEEVSPSDLENWRRQRDAYQRHWRAAI